MKILQKQNHKVYEFWNCSKCLLRYIPWFPFFVLVFLCSAFYYYLSLKNINSILTSSEAVYHYCSCTPHSNLVRIITFYIVVFLPSIFILRFLDSKLCAEYYIVRLSSIRIFMLSKAFCIILLTVSSVVIRLFTFFIGSVIWGNVRLNAINQIVIIFVYLATTLIAFNFLVFLVYTISNHATITFVSFTIALFFSLHFDNSIFMFWVYDLNAYYWNYGTVCADFLLLILILTILLVRPYDVIMREDEKNE